MCFHAAELVYDASLRGLNALKKGGNGGRPALHLQTPCSHDGFGKVRMSATASALHGMIIFVKQVGRLEKNTSSGGGGGGEGSSPDPYMFYGKSSSYMFFSSLFSSISGSLLWIPRLQEVLVKLKATMKRRLEEARSRQLQHFVCDDDCDCRAYLLALKMELASLSFNGQCLRTRRLGCCAHYTTLTRARVRFSVLSSLCGIINDQVCATFLRVLLCSAC